MAVVAPVNPTGEPRPEWWEASHIHLGEFIADTEATEMLMAAVRDGTIHAVNDSMDPYALSREPGENAYHKIGKYLGHSWVSDLGFAAVDVNGGQFRWISPHGRYSQRLQFVHCRGQKRSGSISVNAKGPETRRLAERNNEIARLQSPLFLLDPPAIDRTPVIPLDSPLTVWVVADTYSGGYVCVYLAVALRLTRDGRRLADLADVHLLDEFDLRGGTVEVSEPSSPQMPPETDAVTVVVRDLP